jgi:hypothetical protein
MKWPVIYRDFEIWPDENWGFMWSHVDYDGPEDHRIGTGDTVGDCKVKIDEYLEVEDAQ